MTFVEAVNWAKADLQVNITVGQIRRAARLKKLAVIDLGYRTKEVTPDAVKAWLKGKTKSAREYLIHRS